MMNGLPAELVDDLAALAPADLETVRVLASYLRQRNAGAPAAITGEPAQAWRYSFLEAFPKAEVHSSRDPAGAEVKIAEATVGGESRPSLWQHPPVQGESVVEFHVPVPSGLANLHLQVSVGIRDGTQASDRLVAFRVRADGWQVWSRATWPHTWEEARIALPFRAGDVVRIEFATDGLGRHEWAWAAWADPILTGNLRPDAMMPGITTPGSSAALPTRPGSPST